jgi:hypothetical protein
MIPESQHNNSMARQEFRPRLIANLTCTVVMATAVQFDCQLCPRTIKVQNVIVERVLAAKFVACEVSVPQVSPKNPFRLSGLLSQQSSAIHKDSS